MADDPDKVAELDKIEETIKAALALVDTIPPAQRWRFREAMYESEVCWPIMELDLGSVREHLHDELHDDQPYLLDLRPDDCAVDDVTWLALVPLVGEKPDDWWRRPIRVAAQCEWYDQMSEYLRDQRRYAIAEAVEQLAKEGAPCEANATPTES